MKYLKGSSILFILVIMARSTSFVMTKIGLEDMGTFTLLSFRFILATIFLLPFAIKHRKKFNKRTLIRGMILGFIFHLVMSAEVTALSYTKSSVVAILEHLAIILVPLFEAILIRKLPKREAILSSFIAFTGVVLISGSGVSFSIGQLLGILTGILYAVAIITTDRISKKDDPIILGIVQVASMAVFSFTTALTFESIQLPTSGTSIVIIVILAIVCTGFGFTLQPLAQSKIKSEQASLLLALSPASASILGMLVLNEQLGLRTALGIGFILLSLVFTFIYKRFSFSREKLSLQESLK
ncbi:DMT family transporter [Acidaminobacter sp. JC074]|uniref:DMT family transporter n=1 Tax=Acidaminobacter sp. JC074 TaxID=2530199 RepID=UPI001F0FDF17|nr:DMT family transporter [Acidaminobacter sp. JC074]MCH4889402.1 DMT family transporter [Acidaminobacter sp. JC074]